jgi:uncharacterized protein (TIGR00106 family)
MAVVDLTITARSKEDGASGNSKYIAECHRILQEKGIKHVLTPMSTVLEGEVEEIFSAISLMHERLYEMGAERLYTQIRIDDSKNKTLSMEGKKKAVEDKLKS